MTNASVDALRREWPHWAPWLAVVEETVLESSNRAWERMVPGGAGSPPAVTPLAEGAALAVDARLAGGWIDRLFRTAVREGGLRMAAAAAALGRFDADTLFIASLAQDPTRIRAMAVAGGADPEASQGLGSLVAVPFLQACQRRWAASASAGWMQHYCPICAAWPSFCEERGDAPGRHFRCARCGAAWASLPLRCPFCRTSDHRVLVSLTAGEGPSAGAIDACRGCHGYVKRFATLEGCAPAEVMVKDLATVALDVAAILHGYRRPLGAGCELTTHLEAGPGGTSAAAEWR